MNQADELARIDQTWPEFKEKRTTYDSHFGFHEGHVSYIDESGRREGGGFSANWLFDTSEQIYLYFDNYRSLGHEDKRPQATVCVVFWQDKVFHFHFHELCRDVAEAAYDFRYRHEETPIIYWAIFLVDYVAGWESTTDRDLVAKKMIDKLAHTVGAVMLKNRTPRPCYIPTRLSREAHFVLKKD